VPSDAVYDRSKTSHAVNLFDMAAKYAEVMTTDSCLRVLRELGTPGASATGRAA
jgi:maleamate amidohydrolase